MPMKTHHTAQPLPMPPRAIDAPHIWIDLDGVIFDFVGAALYMLPNFKTIEELNKHPDMRAILHDMYVARPNFFGTLRLTNFAVDLVDIVSSFGMPWGFLSAIGTVHPSPSSVAIQKYTALNNACSTWGDRLVLVPDSCHKQLYAKPSSFLIDDYDKNLAQWAGAGGYCAFIDDEKYLESVFHKLLDFVIEYGYQAEHIGGSIDVYEAVMQRRRDEAKAVGTAEGL